ARPAKKNDYGALPRGVHKMLGVDFDLRGWILLLVPSAKASELGPDQIQGIAVGGKCSQLHFLHAVGGTRSAYAQIGQYTIHYTNGQTVDVPLVYGRDLGDWSSAADQLDFSGFPPPTFQVAWTGNNDFSRRFSGSPMRLFKMSWPNPHPDWEI